MPLIYVLHIPVGVRSTRRMDWKYGNIIFTAGWQSFRTLTQVPGLIGSIANSQGRCLLFSVNILAIELEALTAASVPGSVNSTIKQKGHGACLFLDIHELSPRTEPYDRGSSNILPAAPRHSDVQRTHTTLGLGAEAPHLPNSDAPPR